MLAAFKRHGLDKDQAESEVMLQMCAQTYRQELCRD